MFVGEKHVTASAHTGGEGMTVGSTLVCLPFIGTYGMEREVSKQENNLGKGIK